MVNKIVEQIETFILWLLVLMLLLAVLLSTLGLGQILFRIIVDAYPYYLLIDPKTLFKLFGSFLICLIGLELLKLLKFHISYHYVKPELVVEVAIIALCNKVVTLDMKENTPLAVIGLAALILAFAAVYHVLNRHRRTVDGQ